VIHEDDHELSASASMLDDSFAQSESLGGSPTHSALDSSATNLRRSAWEEEEDGAGEVDAGGYMMGASSSDGGSLGGSVSGSVRGGMGMGGRGGGQQIAEQVGAEVLAGHRLHIDEVSCVYVFAATRTQASFPLSSFRYSRHSGKRWSCLRSSRSFKRMLHRSK
jgi:hypothetical protein